MSFTKQMAEENRAMKERAVALLKEHGWSYEEQYNTPLDERNRNPYYKRFFGLVKYQIVKEFPSVPEHRIGHQVVSAMNIVHGQQIKK